MNKIMPPTFHAWPVAMLMVALLIGLTGSGVARGQTAGTLVAPGGKTLSGTILGTSPNDVEIEDQAGDIKRVPIDRIQEVQFSDEPPSLRQARRFIMGGRPSEAIDEIAKVEQSELSEASPLVMAEMDFVKAAGVGGLAVQTGDGLAAADKEVAGFVGKHARSHHFYEMQQLLAEIRAKAGSFDGAEAAYATLAKGPASFKVQSSAGKAGLLFNQQKFDDAVREYDAALAIDATDDASLSRKRLATLGKARSLARLGKQSEAIALVNGLIKQVSAEDKELMARAYVVLGGIYSGTKEKAQDALISYLTVDLVYNTVPECHAEALYHLITLWKQARQDQRADDAAQTLQAAYPQTQWARKAAGAGTSS
ncbi:MAG: tetratricopeptide repeat protein [Planctomycetia bacterium]